MDLTLAVAVAPKDYTAAMSRLPAEASFSSKTFSMYESFCLPRHVNQGLKTAGFSLKIRVAVALEITATGL